MSGTFAAYSMKTTTFSSMVALSVFLSFATAPQLASARALQNDPTRHGPIDATPAQLRQRDMISTFETYATSAVNGALDYVDAVTVNVGLSSNGSKTPGTQLYMALGTPQIAYGPGGMGLSLPATDAKLNMHDIPGLVSLLSSAATHKNATVRVSGDIGSEMKALMGMVAGHVQLPIGRDVDVGALAAMAGSMGFHASLGEPINSQSSDKESVSMNVPVVMTNPYSYTMDVGDFNVELQADGKPVGTIEIPGMKFVGGSNNFTAKVNVRQDIAASFMPLIV